MSFSNDNSIQQAQGKYERTPSDSLLAGSSDDVADLFEEAEHTQLTQSAERTSSESNFKAKADLLDEVMADAGEESASEKADLSFSTLEKGHQQFELPNVALPKTSSSEFSSSENSQEPITPLTQVPIKISLELGSISCNLQRLIDLRENDVLELVQSIGTIIELKVDGKLIGKGEILRIGDQLGLRINELADR